MHDFVRPKLEPTVEKPSASEIERMVVSDDECTATDGCPVEPDGYCPHGYPSWLLHLGIM
ncbi:MAG: hypothetical protein HZB57_08735 [Gammaproteobacteria bacterium]|nr:hypothetical protein [Gammaproteobacteria bacterium]